MKGFEARGHWHLPAKPDRKVVGTLRFGEEDGINLSLTGSFSDFSSLAQPTTYPLIHGVVMEGPYGKGVTLVDCYQARQTIGTPEMVTEEIRANKAYVCGRLLDEGDLRFDAFRVSLDGLRDWLGISGITVNPCKDDDGPRRLSLDYVQPSSVEAAIRGKPLQIGFGYSLSHVRSGFSLEEKVSIRVEDIAGLCEEEVDRAFLHPLLRFFALATDGPNVIDEYVLFKEDYREHDSEYHAPIYVVRQPVYVPKERPRRRFPHEMLFTYQDVKDSFPDLLNRWFDFSERFSALCDVHFASLYRPGGYVEDRFLTPVRALIFYFEESGAANERVREFRQRALAELQTKLHFTEDVWLSQSMASEAEITFPADLFRALEEHKDLMTPLVGDDLKAFVGAVLAKMNTIYRRDGNAGWDPLEGADLYWTTEKLSVLLKACILEEIGIPRDEAHRFLRRNKNYRQLKATG